jgi:hypothetical protein
MVVVSRYGRLGGVWLVAKEMWSGGCQSLVAILRGREGRARRVLIRGVMERPAGMAREPFWFGRGWLVLWVDVVVGVGWGSEWVGEVKMG